jgi:hypothetical protein
MWKYHSILFIHHMVLWVIPFKRKFVYIDAHKDQAHCYIFLVDCCYQFKTMSIILSKACMYDRLIKRSVVLSIFKRSLCVFKSCLILLEDNEYWLFILGVLLFDYQGWMLDIDNMDHCAYSVCFKKKRSSLAHVVLWFE